MENMGRESTKDNNLFFTCSLIEYIARKTKNIFRRFMIWQIFTIATI